MAVNASGLRRKWPLKQCVCVCAHVLCKKLLKSW